MEPGLSSAVKKRHTETYIKVELDDSYYVLRHIIADNIFQLLSHTHRYRV